VLLPDAAALYAEGPPTYGRAGLATQETLMSALASLEGAAGVRLFPSGLAAMTGAMLAVAKAGDDVLVTDAIYKPTRRFCDRVLTRFGVTVRYYRPSLEAEALAERLAPATRLLVMESPGSLSFEVQDAAAIAKMAKSRGVITLLDNTWAAGHLFKPLAHGVDLSVQALTKYVGGHSDLFMGSAAASDPALVGALDRAVLDYGWAVAPEDAYQMLRGLRTLDVRLARHGASALAVAAWLRARPEVAEVLFPALAGAPGHGLWKRDFTGAAGLFSIVLRPCRPAAVAAFLDSLRLFGLGFSWGGFESLAIDCGPQFEVRAFGAPFETPVIRLNIGLEDPGDLIADLEAGFEALATA